MEEGDYKATADLQAELKALLEARAHTEELEQHRQGLEQRLGACVKEGDFKTAADLQAELKALLKISEPHLEAKKKRNALARRRRGIIGSVLQTRSRLACRRPTTRTPPLSWSS